MGFHVYYRSTRPVTRKKAATIERAAEELGRGRTWLSSEPVVFYADQDDGHMFGGSKPVFEPGADEAAAAAKENLPDGTIKDVLDILCELSREHEVSWEISHDYSGGPIGCIHGGVCDREVLKQIKGLAKAGRLIQEFAGEFEPPADVPQTRPRRRQRDPDNEDDEPQILKFKPKGE